MKPTTLCKLQKGKLIDSQEHFVETFNWMVDFIQNLKGYETPYTVQAGDRIKIEVNDDDGSHPQLQILQDPRSTSLSGTTGGGEIKIKCVGNNGETTATLGPDGYLVFQTGDNSNVSYTCQSLSGDVVIKADVGWYVPTGS